jgi:23S rRNA (cytosine1962-C5)-methyltransferase
MTAPPEPPPTTTEQIPSDPAARRRARRLARLARYQLRKEAVGVVLRDAPWIFRDHLSSAADVFKDGQWLRLVDGKNRVLGFGMYEEHGAIAIRVLRRGEAPPDGAWVASQVDAALARRAGLREETDAFRAVHGEGDGLPAVIADVFGDTVVVQSYARGADALTRLVGGLVARRLGLSRVVLKPAQRRQASGGGAEPKAPRWLRGGAGGGADGAAPIAFREGPLALACDPLGGQKSGAYLDLRGLRRYVAAMPLGGARVLNLFSYTGMLGRAAEHAGAAEIVQVDASAEALALAARHHVGDPARHRFLEADVFAWLPAQPPGGDYQLVIVDPPSMTSRRAQVPGALAAYKKLYRAAAAQVAPGGTLVLACCTSRITREEVRRASGVIGPAFEAIGELPTEVDHPVTFAESDYLKILLFRRRG